ncbi:MAG: ATP-dependent RNA helicase [Treponema sp.]|nr:ATP-dependent RNA helicase [Treponema sp.]
MDYKKLPVYEQKDKILEYIKNNQVIVVQSPTGSGKTTQLPVILHEAGFSDKGIIAVTQPRRIAAVSVSEFIAKQLGTEFPGLVGYKMRFEDKTNVSTKIKIMTDGILLQEMKLDPWLSKYSVVIVDEAHERSLNIDFILGLLKRVLQTRSDFKIIVSSATMNVEAFSVYFDNCSIVTIDTITFPVTVVYDPPSIPASTSTIASTDALLAKIENIIDRVLTNREHGDILCFLPGEKTIKDCMWRLMHSPLGRRLHIIPLYGRLAKEEQERVFDSAPFGKKKLVIATNIAETSVTIPGITIVIDCGLAKLNFYNPRTFTSSLNETTVSKASCNQRKGRAGRTQPGICYRLYSKKDFDTRALYTTEEIYRTDLSEVVLRMAELNIIDFEQFDFISTPGKDGIRGAVETLKMLKAINDDHTLSEIGKLMILFPLMPRISRIIVESIMHYPEVMEEVLIASGFLSAQSPFILPPGEETDARQAHHSFREIFGDFLSYVRLFNAFTNAKNGENFCTKFYLDYRIMNEIANIKEQLQQIVSDIGIPISSGGSVEKYLQCIACGMIQFVCIREGKDNYRSLTAENIQIHPGSNMFRQEPLYIVAGEIVRTSRMFAMSVSPLTKNILQKIDPTLEISLNALKRKNKKTLENNEITTLKDKKSKKVKTSDVENTIKIGNTIFTLVKIKGKKTAILPFDKFKQALELETDKEKLKVLGGLKGKIIFENKMELLSGEKLELIITLMRELELKPIDEKSWNRKLNLRFQENSEKLINSLQHILSVTVAKQKSKELGFICMFTDNNGAYWFKVSRGFATALNESLASLETLIDEASNVVDAKQKMHINDIYRKLNNMYENL